jgi:hypothetical protein
MYQAKREGDAIMARMLIIVAIAGLIVLVIGQNLSDIQRYMRIRSM